MDDNLKAISLAAGTDAGGIAIAPDSTVWVTDKRDAPTGTAGQIFSILPDGSKYDAHPLPKVPDGRGKPQPAYVALQTNGNSVEAVWVSDVGAGVVYWLKPGTKDPEQVGVVDIGKDSRPRGLAWDQARQRVWVADEGGHQLLAIDPARSQLDPALKTSRPGSAIALVAVSPQGVWFTEFAPGKVSVLDAKKAVKEFDVGLVSDDGTRKAISYPYGLAVDGNSVWITANGMGESPGELWTVDDTSNLETAKLRKVVSFGGDPSPRDIAVDTAGYLWVSLFYGHKVVQITNAGVVVKEYDVDASALPGAIAYGSNQDEIWVSDETAGNHRVIRLTPIDKIGPARDGKIAISATSNTGAAAKGKLFPAWKVAVKENNEPVERHITLSIEPPSKASFEDGQSSIIVKTDKTTGEFSIETLKAAASAANGDQFVVKATTRGLTTPVTIYTAHIAEDNRIDKTPLPITDVTVADKVYDGTLAATLHGGRISPVPGDALSLETTGATGEFATKDVGQHISVTASGYTLSGADAGKYDLKQPAGLAASITAKLLTVEVDPATRRLRQPNPTFHYTITGFVPGEDEKLVTGLQVTTTADANSRPGDYPIKASGGSAPNYTFKYVDGSLTIRR